MQSEPRLILPFMRPLYARLADFSYPLIRLAGAGAVLVHGIGKLMTGPAPVIANMARYGFQPAEPIAYLIIFLETVGAACVILGLFTRFFAFALCIESLVIAFRVQSANGFFANRNGYEMVLIWAIVFLAISLRGAGPYSIDRSLGREL
jgi:putative oxidoreductase